MLHIRNELIDITCRQTVNIEASNIVITRVTDTADGLEIEFYVRGIEGGVIMDTTVVEALRVSPHFTTNELNKYMSIILFPDQQ